MNGSTRSADNLQGFMHASLACGIAVPFLYYGAQLFAMPFYEGYSPVRQVASMLGSSESSRPMVFNAGVILTGLATIAAAPGFRRALNRHGITMMATLVSFSLISSGLASVWAGVFPLPDPRHNPGPMGAGVFAFPVLIALAMWPLPSARLLRRYFVVNLALYAVMAFVLSGLAGVDVQPIGGALQRVFALVAYVPVGVVAWWLRGRRPQ